MRALVFVLIAAVAAPLWAQEKPAEKPDKEPAKAKVSNVIDDKELGCTSTAPGAGRSNAPRTAAPGRRLRPTRIRIRTTRRFSLQVRNNIYDSFERFKQAIESEFKDSPEGAAPEAGKRLLRGVAIKEAKMRRGAQLAGFEVTANSVELTKEGKKRRVPDDGADVLRQAPFVPHRVPRAPRSIQEGVRRVRAGVARAAGRACRRARHAWHVAEELQRQVHLQGARGFSVELPKKNANSNLHLRNRDVELVIYSYPYDGDVRDHLDDVVDFYDTEFKVENDEAKVLGKSGFIGLLTRRGRTAHIVGTVVRGQAVRIHAYFQKDDRAAAEKATASLLKTFKVG